MLSFIVSNVLYQNALRKILNLASNIMILLCRVKKNETILQHHVDKLRKTFDSGNCTVC